jgi:hypothetical protein
MAIERESGYGFFSEHPGTLMSRHPDVQTSKDNLRAIEKFQNGLGRLRGITSDGLPFLRLSFLLSEWV